MPSKIPRPGYNVELGAVLAQLPIPTVITREMVPAFRENVAAMSTLDIINGTGILHIEHTIPGPSGNIILSILQQEQRVKPMPHGRPGIYNIHGGGLILGNRFTGIEHMIDWIKECDAVCISVEYRLAPEHPDPAPIEDCYAGLLWVGSHLRELGINPERLMISGSSAGGGLAAGTALMVRDKGGPKLCAQMLMCPMLDDRNEHVSTKQYVDEGVWSRGTNLMAWECVLGDRRGGPNVSIYTAPARAKDLSGLPPAFIDVGSAELFRDEDVAYASLLWASGVDAELNVWPGGFHTFDVLVPAASISKTARETRIAWVRRTLATQNPLGRSKI